MKSKQQVEEIVYINFPWATVSGYFNGDIFEDWLRSPAQSEPEKRLKQFFKARDAKIYEQAKSEIEKKIKGLL